MHKKFTLKNLLLSLFILFLQNSFAQKTIQGKIFDENGIAIMGANVWISGTTIGTATLFDGSYQLKVPEGYFEVDLKTSYLGFQQNKFSINLDEWDVNDKKDILLKKEDIRLSEVVISVYQMGHQENVTICRGLVKSKAILRCDTPENCNQMEDEDVEIEKAIIQIFPNPFVSFIKVQIEVEEEEEDYLFELFGIDGKFIFAERQLLNNEQEVVRLDLPNLPVGSYVLRIKQGEKIVQSDILIKASAQ